MPPLNEDQSAATLAASLSARLPFYFIKLGDAAVEIMNGYGKATCDGELYTEDLRRGLRAAWNALGKMSGSGSVLYVGDWSTASFSGAKDKSRYASEYDGMMAGSRGVFLHFECLLLMRESPELLGFYRAVRDDPRRKLLLGPVAWAPMARLLGCDFLGLPVMPNLYDIHTQIAAELKSRDFEVLLYGAGTAGHVSVIDCWIEHPGRTYINLGSALDPATSMGRTRKQQIAPNRAKAFLAQIECRVTTTGRGDALLKAYDAENAHLMDRDLI